MSSSLGFSNRIYSFVVNNSAFVMHEHGNEDMRRDKSHEDMSFDFLEEVLRNPIAIKK